MNASITELHLPLSSQTGILNSVLEDLKREHLNIWSETAEDFPDFSKFYSRIEKSRNEQEAEQLLEQVVGHLDRPDEVPQLGPETLIERLSGLIGIRIPGELSSKMIRSSKIFLEKVRSFDSGLEVNDIYQALRNIWIMNSLQVYLGLPVNCTDPMFSYSLLYPYTDNLMDNRFLSFKRKIEMCLTLKSILEGEGLASTGGLEVKLARLIGNIETAFPRKRFPEVFQSLILIFNAQVRSLAGQQGRILPGQGDILDISFEKGGSSVLADGYLLGGRLDLHQQKACFGWGTFLQLSDDIQDVVLDRRNRHWTLFSSVAGQYPLDKLASRLLNYITRIMSPVMSGSGMSEGYMKFSLNNFRIMIVEAIGKNPALFSREYVDRMEAYSPFGFAFLKRLRKTLNRRLKKKRYLADMDTLSTGFLTLTSRLHEAGTF